MTRPSTTTGTPATGSTAIARATPAATSRASIQDIGTFLRAGGCVISSEGLAGLTPGAPGPQAVMTTPIPGATPLRLRALTPGEGAGLRRAARNEVAAGGGTGRRVGTCGARLPNDNEASKDDAGGVLHESRVGRTARRTVFFVLVS